MTLHYTTQEERWLEVNRKAQAASDAACASYAHSPGYQQADKPAALQGQVGGDHYTSMKIQPIEYIQANRIPFPEGNIIKYVSRWRAKGGIKDLRKAAHHLELLIEYELANPTKYEWSVDPIKK